MIYGSTSSVFDPTSVALSIGCPELSMIVSASVQMARFYNLPSRSGFNFILHAAGILGSYSAMSFEKFLLDEEVRRMLLNLSPDVNN